MTEGNGNDSSEESRRSFMRKGALASGAAALGLSSSGSAAAQEEGTETAQDSGTATAQADDGAVRAEQGRQALIFANEFNPNARFAFISDALDWSPNFGDVRGGLFTDYDTYMIRWSNTGEIAPFFVASDANVGEFNDEAGFVVDADDDPDQPQLFQMSREFATSDENQQLLQVQFSPVPEDEEDAVLAVEPWWQRPGEGDNDN